MDSAQAGQSGSTEDQARAARGEAGVVGNEKADVAADVADEKADKAKGAYTNAINKVSRPV